jgi:hypothetical protein
MAEEQPFKAIALTVSNRHKGDHKKESSLHMVFVETRIAV